MSRKSALVTGVGPGTGAAIVRRLAEGGYDVAMLARNEERLAKLQAEVRGARAYAVDVTDEAGLAATLDAVENDLGAPEIVVHNAVGGAFGGFRDIDPSVLEQNFRINVMALLHLARRTTPSMIERGRGALVVTGNTSALRGKPSFAGFAPTKAAQRILTESIARELGPKGVHVSYLVIDAVIDLEWTRRMRPDAPDEYFIQPEEIAAEVWHIVNQPRGAWSFLVEVRPFGETW